MKRYIKQTIVVGMLAFVSFVGLASPTPVSALTCGGATTSIIGGTACSSAVKDGSGQSSAIWSLLLFVLNIMTAGVGILAVGGIVYGSVLYASAGGKTDQAKKAITVITNVVIGIFAYGAMYFLLNFIVPGGIFQ